MPAVRDAVVAALANGSWGQYVGPHGDRLRECLAKWHDLPLVKLCASGTVGIELALRGLGIRSGDEVLLAGYDFSGNFRAVERIDARPVLADVDPRTLTIDPAQLSTVDSMPPRAMVVSHLHSCLAPMPELMEWARQHGVLVVEDICQAQGASVAGRPAGSWGDIAVTSFGGSKLTTAGRGGAILTRHPEYYQRIVAYAEQGNDAYPLSELQAAAILPQWRRLPEDNGTRRRGVTRLVAQLEDIPCLKFAGVLTGADRPSYYKVAWWYDSTKAQGVPRDQFAAAVCAEGVAWHTGFRGFVKRSPRRCRRVGSLEASQKAATQLVVLHHPVLLQDAETIDGVARAVRKVVASCHLLT